MRCPFFFCRRVNSNPAMVVYIDGKAYNGIEVGGRRYPVNPYLITSKLLFRVVVDRGQQFYSSPDAYYFHRMPKPKPRYEEDDISGKLREWAEKRADFMTTHESWYDRVEAAKNDMHEFLKHSKIDPHGNDRIPREQCYRL